MLEADCEGVTFNLNSTIFAIKPYEAAGTGAVNPFVKVYGAPGNGFPPASSKLIKMLSITNEGAVFVASETLPEAAADSINQSPPKLSLNHSKSRR